MFIKPNRQVSKVFIHCSASDVKAHDNIAIITKWHIDPKPPKGVKKTAGYGNGWKWVGYHYFIRQDGTIEEGRPLEVQPSAQGLYKGKYYNAETIAICLSGGQYGKADFFTQDQFDSLIELCKEINYSYYNKVSFHGHCEVSDKKCPVFNYKKVLDLDDNGYIKSLSLFTNSKPKKKMIPLVLTGAVSLVKLFAPTIFRTFKNTGKTLTEKIAKKLIKKVESKLGFEITDEKSAKKAAEQLDSKDVLELEKLALKTNVKAFIAELKFGEKLGGWNLKDDWVTLYAVLFPCYITKEAFKDPKLTLEVIEVVAKLFATPFGIVFVVACISAVGGKNLLNKIVGKFIR